MKRAGLLYCTDCDPYRFAAFKRRDQLPFATDDQQVIRWQDFSLKDAFELRFMLDCIDHEGVTTAFVRYMLGAVRPSEIRHHPLNNGPDDPAIWVAGAILTNDVSEFVDDVPKVCAAGSAENILAKIHEKATERRESPVRIVAVNATRAANFVRSRAVEMELSEGTDFSPIWSHQ